MIKVLGIDMAFTNVGLAMVQINADDTITVLDLHCIHTESVKKRPKGMTKASDDLRRARESLNGIKDRIATWQPDIVVAEVPFGSQSARASWALGIAIGVLASIDGLIEVTPRQVKAATGEPYADKDEMIAWAMDRHPEAPWAWRKYKGALISVASTNEHTADALAAVYAARQTKEFKERLHAKV